MSDPNERPEDYVVYGAPFSLFTRKLEAALRFYDAPHRMEAKGPDHAAVIEARARTHQVPVLHTPENWMIADTTPILDLLDARFPRRRLVPPGPLGVLVHVVEEVLDEWIARVMVHFRWHYAENTRFVVGHILGRDLSLEEAQRHPIAQWGPRACRATGTEGEHQQRAAEREYFALLAALESQLGQSRYVLGDRPTAVDCMLLGGLRAHTNNDPVPDLGAYAGVLAWEEKEADRWDGAGALAAFPDGTPFARHVLALAREQYAPFVLGNAHALAAGEKAFVIDTYGEPTSYLARPYPEQSRRLLQARIRDRLEPVEQRQVTDWLHAAGLACFLP